MSCVSWINSTQNVGRVFRVLEFQVDQAQRRAALLQAPGDGLRDVLPSLRVAAAEAVRVAGVDTMAPVGRQRVPVNARVGRR